MTEEVANRLACKPHYYLNLRMIQQNIIVTDDCNSGVGPPSVRQKVSFDAILQERSVCLMLSDSYNGESFTSEGEKQWEKHMRKKKWPNFSSR